VTAVALGLIINIYREYGTIEENEILELNRLEEVKMIKQHSSKKEN